MSAALEGDSWRVGGDSAPPATVPVRRPQRPEGRQGAVSARSHVRTRLGEGAAVVCAPGARSPAGAPQRQLRATDGVPRSPRHRPAGHRASAGGLPATGTCRAYGALPVCRTSQLPTLGDRGSEDTRGPGADTSQRPGRLAAWSSSRPRRSPVPLGPGNGPGFGPDPRSAASVGAAAEKRARSRRRRGDHAGGRPMARGASRTGSRSTSRTSSRPVPISVPIPGQRVCGRVSGDVFSAGGRPASRGPAVVPVGWPPQVPYPRSPTSGKRTPGDARYVTSLATPEARGPKHFPHQFPNLFPPGPGSGPDPRSEGMSAAFGGASPSEDLPKGFLGFLRDGN